MNYLEITCDSEYYLVADQLPLNEFGDGSGYPTYWRMLAQRDGSGKYLIPYYDGTVGLVGVVEEWKRNPRDEFEFKYCGYNYQVRKVFEAEVVMILFGARVETIEDWD